LKYKVFLHPKAAQFLERADPALDERIKESLRELRNSPRSKGERLRYSSFFRLRVGDYRAIYEIDDEKNRVVVLFIGHRREVYDDFSRLL